MSDIIDEAQEDLEREKWQKLWNDWGRSIIAGCVGIVLGTGAISGYKSYQTSVNEGATAKLIDIVQPELGNVLDTTKLLEVEDDLPARHRAIARMIAIGDLISSDELSRAEAELSELIEEDAVDHLLLDLARVQLAALYVENFDRSVADVEAVLKPIFSDNDNPWYAQAKLNLALAQANKEQSYSSASATLDRLFEKQNPDMPRAVLDQAAKLRQFYTIKAREEG